MCRLGGVRSSDILVDCPCSRLPEAPWGMSTTLINSFSLCINEKKSIPSWRGRVVCLRLSAVECRSAPCLSFRFIYYIARNTVLWSIFSQYRFSPHHSHLRPINPLLTAQHCCTAKGSLPHTHRPLLASTTQFLSYTVHLTWRHLRGACRWFTTPVEAINIFWKSRLILVRHA